MHQDATVHFVYPRNVRSMASLCALPRQVISQRTFHFRHRTSRSSDRGSPSPAAIPRSTVDNCRFFEPVYCITCITAYSENVAIKRSLCTEMKTTIWVTRRIVMFKKCHGFPPGINATSVTLFSSSTKSTTASPLDNVATLD